MNTERIRVKDFTLSPVSGEPGPGVEEQTSTGSAFFSQVLNPAFERIKAGKEDAIEVDLDGPTYYTSAFIRASFGKLASTYGKEYVKSHLKLLSSLVPLREVQVWRAVDRA